VNKPVDLVVVGAGVAGLTAARAAQRSGANVLVLDKGDGQQGNNSRMSGGRFHAAYLDPRSHEPDELYQAIVGLTSGAARSDVARAWADHVVRSLLFLEEEGARFAKGGPPELVWNELQPSRHNTDQRSKDPWRGFGPDLLSDRMVSAIRSAGGEVRTSSRVTHLEEVGGAPFRVRATTPDGDIAISARDVVLADGGFQGNPELVARYVTRHAYRLWCSTLDTGDALLMGLELDAATVEMSAVYGRVTLRDTLDPALASLPAPTMLINASIVVNSHGQRFFDEASKVGDQEAGPDHDRYAELSDFENVAALAANPADGDSWLVFDASTWATMGASAERATFDPRPHAMTLNPTLVERGGTLLTAASIAELAAAASIDATGLEATVEAFNRFSAGDGALQPTRSDRRHARPIVDPPFHAIPLIPGILYTMGGLLVDGHARVLRTSGDPIPHLYAAGGTMGGLQGGPRLGYSGGWSEASTFGLLAGEHAACDRSRDDA
jgi:fumarate reductase flavoprotein subunit